MMADFIPRAPVKVPLGSIVRQMTMQVEITGARTWSYRLRFAMWLIRLAARVIGCNVRVEVV